MANLSATKCSFYHFADYIEKVIGIDITFSDFCTFWHSQFGILQNFLVLLYQEFSEESEEEEWLHLLFSILGFPFMYSGY